MKLCGFNAGLDHPLFLIAGPCAIESEQLALDTAGRLHTKTNLMKELEKVKKVAAREV